MEERSFLSSVCDEIGTVGDLQTLAATVDFPSNRLQQILTSFPHDFPAAVFAVVAGWYTTSRLKLYEKVDELEEAFSEMNKGALFSRIIQAHSAALQRAATRPRVRRPSVDSLDESLGEAVMNAIDIIPGAHLRLIRTLLRELMTDGDLLTVAAACGINPVLVVAVTESRMRPSQKAARVFLPWYAQSDLVPRAKYLRLKFGFQCASLLAVFNNILEHHRPDVLSYTLPRSDDNLFELTFAPSVCVSAEETRQMLNEWEFTFLTILCNAIFNMGQIAAIIPTLQVPTAILQDAACVHGLPSEQNALTAHILFEWWCSAPITLTEKLTHLQCALTGVGLGPTYYTALKSYGRFLYHFVSADADRASTTFPTHPPAAPAGHGEGVTVTRGFIVGPRVPTQTVLDQIADEMRQFEQDKENRAIQSADSGIVEDDTHTPGTSVAVGHHVLDLRIGQPARRASQDATPARKNPFVKLIRL